MSDSQAVLDARAEVERRRAQLLTTARAVQYRVSPKTIARGAWEDAKEKGAGLAETAVDAVASRPVAIGAAASAIALFLAREPLLDLAGRLFNSDTKPGRATNERKRIRPRQDGSSTPRRRQRAG